MKILSKLRTFFRKGKFDAEMGNHVELQAELNRKAGMNPDEAHYAALRQFGNVGLVQEHAREGRGWVWLGNLGRDVHFSLRSLRRAPVFSAAVITTLALCIGANTTILSVLYSLVLKPLPFSQPGQLVSIVNVSEKSGGQRVSSSTPQYVDFKAHADLFSNFSVIRRESVTLDEVSAPVRLSTVLVAGDFFGLLGVKPVVGRFFTPDEEVVGGDSVLVLSHAFWAGHYGAEAAVIGSVVRLGEQQFTIIGVAPSSLESVCYQTAFFRPYVPSAAKYDPQARFRGDLDLYARLKPKVSLEAGRAQLVALETDFMNDQATPQMRAFAANAGFRLDLEPMRAGGAAGEMNSLWLLEGGALLVLLIGCVNVASLFLARMKAKQNEFALRLALGAGWSALIRQLLTESFLLTGAATIAGIGLGLLSLRLFNQYLPLIVAAAPPVVFDATLTFAMVGAAGGIALLVGILPVRLLWRGGLRVSASRSASSGGGNQALGGALVTAQVAIAVILLVGASLQLRSFAKVMAVDPGFDAAQVVQGAIALPSRYNNPADNVGVQRRILESLKTIPGVENAALSLDSVLATNVRPVPFGVRNGSQPSAESESLIHINAVSPDFFATMGMRVVSGRDFSVADDFINHPVAIVDETFGQHYFPGRMMEGQEIYLSRGLPLAKDAWPRIVGVVNRANFTGLDSHDTIPMVYVPMVDYPRKTARVLVRSSRPASDLVREIRSKLQDIDSTLPFYAAASLNEGLDNQLSARRGITLLIGLFSGLALLLAGIGLYGLLAYDVSQRTREIGIRAATGASRGQIVAMILHKGMRRTALGLAGGLAGAIYLTQFLRKMLFAVGDTDPLSYAGVVALLMLVALLASWLPAWRAAKVDPVIALRAE